MKRFLFFILVISFFSINETIAQNTAFKNGISFKTLFLDYQSQNGGDISAFKDYNTGFEIAFHRHINSNIKIVVPFHMGIVGSHTKEEEFRKTIYGIDAQFNYQFIKEKSTLVPYLIAGVGTVAEIDGEMNIQVPFGFGLNFKLNSNAFINWQSTYRYSFSDDRNNLQHGLGFIYLFGKSAKKEMTKVKEEDKEKKTMFDSDGDGVMDDLDLCPQEAGLEALKGCPDTDGDGISDFEDLCPEFAGLKSMKGCPDSDDDGVSDNEDECPNLKGVISNKGCPPSNLDTDGDGVLDRNDNCPNIYGNANNKGCPKIIQAGDRDRDGDGVMDNEDKCPDAAGLSLFGGCPDTDGDGMDDGRDKCPKLAGPVSNMGCPEIRQEDKKTLEIAMRAVQFNSGKSTIKSSSFQILKQIRGIMERYPNYKLTISGHTDNTGRASINQSLSERRARACHDYLAKAGVSSGRMSHAGYGETRPIADNNTLSGRTLNRRVEFKLLPY